MFAPGPIPLKLSGGEKQTMEKLYIVENIIMPLLGCHSSLRICADSIDIATLNSTYPKLCRSLGMTCWPYASKPKHGATPLFPESPRRIPLPLVGKVKAELKLKSMENLGVISPVGDSNDWCVGNQQGKFFT